MKHVGVIGALNIDLILRGEAPLKLEDINNWTGASDVYCLTAGSVGYFTQNLRKLNCDMHLVSTIADDSFGEIIKSTLTKAKINTNYLSIEPNTQSAIAIYMLLFGSPKRPLTFRLPTHHGFPPRLSADQKEFLLNTDLLHCGGFLHFPDLWNSDILKLFARAKELGIKTSLDPQFPLSNLAPPWSKVLKPLLNFVDVLFMDENEAIGISGTDTLDHALPLLRELDVPIIAVKLGEKGAVVLENHDIIEQPAVKPIKFVDSIGAGDSFDAGFLYGLLHDKNVKDSARLAAYMAAKSCEGVGGTIAFPSDEELPKNLL